MKTISTYFIKSFILLVCVLASSQVYAWKPIMIGNNGCCKGVENTEEAFINAATEYGFQGIKTVVQVTNDNRYVCWSNGKTNNGIIPKELLSNKDYNVDISGNSLRSLETCQLQQTRTMEDQTTKQTFTGKICTVDRFFEICKEHNVFPLIELHWTKDQFDQWFSGLYDLIYEYGMVNKVIISTPTQEILTYLNTYHPEFQQSQRQYFINRKITDADITFCVSNKCDISACYWIKSDEKITLNDVTKCHNAGVKVAAWAPNNISGYEGYGVYGLNYIISSELGPNKVELPELAGEDPNYVDNSTRTIYFRPSTVVLDGGYSYSGGSADNVAWTKHNTSAQFGVVEYNPSDKSAVYHTNSEWKSRTISPCVTEIKNSNGNIVCTPGNHTVTSSRFLPVKLSSNNQFAFYRTQAGATFDTSLDDGFSGNTWNVIPNNEWWNTSPTVGWDDEFIAVSELVDNDYNMFAVQEGYWAGGTGEFKGYYFGYFLEKATQVYFAKHGEVDANWDVPHFVRGKDIYAYKHEMKVIDGTRLYFIELTPGFGFEDGFAYTDYGFIGKVNNWGSVNDEDKSLWKVHPADVGEDPKLSDYQKKSLSYRLNNNEITPRTNLRQDKLTGMNLFTPGANSVDNIEKNSLTSWKDLNHTLTVYAQPSSGSSLTCTSYKLTNAQTAVADSKTGFTAATFGMAYTADVTITAQAKEGFRFEGWYVNSYKIDDTSMPAIQKTNYVATSKSGVETLTFCAPNTDITVVAKFVPTEQTQAFSVLTYNPNLNQFIEYTTGNAGKIAIQYTDKNGTTKTTETESSCVLLDAKEATNIKLTATLTNDEYEFIGWWDYTTDTELSTDLSYTYKVTPRKIIQARFAPIDCWQVIVRNNIGGLFTVQYSRDEDFKVSQSKESALDHWTYTHFSFGTTYVKVSPQPIVGYKLLQFKVGGMTTNAGETIKYAPTYDPEKGKKSQVVTNFVREDEQVVYLNLKGKTGEIPNGWATNDPNQHAYYAFVDNSFFATRGELQLQWIKMDHVQDYCYRCTIPGNKYNRISFVQICKDSEGNFVTDGRNQEPITKVNINFDTIQQLGLNYVRDTLKVERRRTTLSTIPATTSNCLRLSALWKGGGWIDCWTTPPTHQYDYRLLYREQTVKSKTEIEIDYEHNSDIVKYVAEGTKVDTLSLHIYNKVSNDGVNGINNPEIILQQYDGSKWVDKESYMVFGPLKSDNPSVIRMPERKNSAEIVVNRGIDIIKNDPTDNGCGVWNFPITQTNGEVTLNLDKICRYSGNYYICTSNADGGRENYIHPANVLKYSKYAKENDRGYSHYFLRFIDVTTNDRPGTYQNVKFNIACDYASFLSKEHLTWHDRFKNEKGEYDKDLYVMDVSNEPALPVNANVRFSWDIITNRVFRAYIAETSDRQNEHLILSNTEGVSEVNPTDQYFNDNGDWVYSIDFTATSSAKAKVKAKYNTLYQYIMGSEYANAPITVGTGESSYPVRMLYDFKDDRLVTFYKPNGTINNNIELTIPLMIVREHHNEATQIKFANEGNQITTKEGDEDDQYANPVYAVLTFLKSKLTDPAISHFEKEFYWISFPFDVKIKDAFGLGKYGQNWLIETYDGSKRANEGLVTTGWKYITNTGTILKANKGYVLWLNYDQVLNDNLFDGTKDGKLSLFFPSRYLQNKQVIKNEEDVVVSLPEYVSNATAPHHWNWHTIGVPSFANSKVTIEQNDMPFVYEYWHPGDAYGPVAHGEKPLKAMHSYMAQYSGYITWESIIRMTPQSLAAKKDADADKKLMLRLELQQAGSSLDKTYVQLRNDKGTKGFDMSLDLTKIINAGANIYSIVDNHEMAGNAIPKDETVLPLGVVITAAGEYTFAMPNGTEGMIVELIDYEQGTSTNLLVGDYTVTLDKGTFNQRFALRLKPDKVATSVDNIGNEANGDEVRKLLIDGVLYLVKDGAVYDAQGHCVR